MGSSASKRQLSQSGNDEREDKSVGGKRVAIMAVGLFAKHIGHSQTSPGLLLEQDGHDNVSEISAEDLTSFIHRMKRENECAKKQIEADIDIENRLHVRPKTASGRAVRNTNKGIGDMVRYVVTYVVIIILKAYTLLVSCSFCRKPFVLQLSLAT